MNLGWYFGFFVVSGFCTLMYEVVWLRLAMAKFGVTTPMVSIVLSVFMAGLALGSWIGGRMVSRAESWGPARPLRLYGLVELLIGASGLSVPYLLQFGYELNRRAGSGLRWDSGAYYLASGGWIVISLLPWCTAMGATFPLAMAAIRNIARDRSHRSFSYLYRANVLGAILGTLVPALFLIELVGFQKTLYIASSLNLILAVSVFSVSSGLPRFPAPIAPASTATVNLASVTDAVSARKILWLLFLTGLCTMAMEVVWIRQFTIFLGNVVYSLAIILALYLAATWTGSYLYHRRARTHELQASAAAWSLLGLLALLPLAFADPTLPVPREWKWAVFRTAAAIGPLSTTLGFLTPFLVDQFSAGNPDRAGRAYAVNIVGGILGPLFSGFVILPWLGDRLGLVALSLPLFSIGVVAALRKASKAIPISILPGAQNKVPYWVTVCLAILLVAFTSDYKGLLTRRVELRDYMATVIAAENNGHKRLLINGVGMTSLTPITKYMAHLPLAFLSRPARNGLVICFGMGTTFRSMLSWGIDTTVVELNPSVPELFSYFHKDAPELVRLPRAHIVIDDGRRFLERATEQYDVITMDPPPPISTPTTSLLYSREFYEAAKKHLRPGGILQAWLPVLDPGWDLSTQTAFAKSLRDSFPYVRVFPCLGAWGFHMLASERPIPVRTPKQLAAQMPRSAAADLVEWNPNASPMQMFDAVLGVEQPISRLASIRPQVPPIQDDRPINEYFFLRRLSGL
jgi:predicted membrane-bound spermidine synthase